MYIMQCQRSLFQWQDTTCSQVFIVPSTVGHQFACVQCISAAIMCFGYQRSIGDNTHAVCRMVCTKKFTVVFTALWMSGLQCRIDFILLLAGHQLHVKSSMLRTTTIHKTRILSMNIITYDVYCVVQGWPLGVQTFGGDQRMGLAVTVCYKLWCSMASTTHMLALLHISMSCSTALCTGIVH